MDCTVSIKISAEDLSMLRRIAKAENRRFDDLTQLLFAEGLDYFFCEEIVSVKKLPEEYTEQEKKQEELNNKIRKEDYDSFAEMKAAGYIVVQDYFSNHRHDSETKEYHDDLIKPMVQRLRDIATN